MKTADRFRTLFVCLLALCAALPGVPLQAQTQTSSLKGIVTDPSGAFVPGALVQLRGPGGESRAKTDDSGLYSFPALKPGTYAVRVIAKGFTLTDKGKVDITGPATLDVQLSIEAEAQVINVEEEANKVSADPASNGTAIVLGEKELSALSDDPDELSQELQAMAGPGAGPNGGQIYIDGFTGGNMPPKSSIREVRINSNPFSSEYDRPGFGRIEILTKPGTDNLHGQAFMQYNKEALNSRSPLLTQSTRPPYKQQFYGFNLGGPIKKQKASFGLDFEHRTIDENAFVLATTLDSNLLPQQINQAIVTPQTRQTISPRIDYMINQKNTVVVRYQDTRIEMDKQGVGNYSLLSQAYDQKSTEKTLQVTETAVLSPRMINESRFQFLRTQISNNGDNSVPAITVQGAFEDGGAQIGKSSTTNNRWELTNASTYTAGRHTIKWGGRLRQSFINDTSVNNFGGSYVFFGGVGPELDAGNQAIAGTSVQLTALERYRRTLLFQQLGFTPDQIRTLGGGASQFQLNAGVPTANISQFDIGLFFNDDWRIKPNLTVSYGLRYETQTNIHDLADWSPRFGLAWGIDGKGTKPAKTVLRAGFGIFYDRIADTASLAADRYNGLTQQSYLIQNPNFYPAIPALSQLAGNSQPQQLQILYSGLRAPETMQASIGMDRQLNKYVKLSAQFVESRGVHLSRTLNINTPLSGVYPYGDQDVRLLTETNGFSRSHQLFISPNVNYKKLFLFGFYALSYGKDDNEGQPANPYNLAAEWGPSSFADVRHRAVMGTSLPLPGKVSVSPFLIASSGSPYNITTGQDPLGVGIASARPALLSGLTATQCSGGSLLYESRFGCFNLSPAPGAAVIGRNYGRGPANVTLNLRVARTWAFGSKGESGLQNMGGMGGPGGPPPGGMRGGGGPPGGGPGGPPPGMFGGNSGKKYNLTLSIQARNVLNHANFGSPSGDLSSPYFGESRSLAGFGPFGGSSTYNRKIDLQLRFQF